MWRLCAKQRLSSCAARAELLMNKMCMQWSRAGKPVEASGGETGGEAAVAS